LEKAGIQFPGTQCKTPDDLLKKYKTFCISDPENLIIGNETARKIQQMHAAAMSMKVDDDKEDSCKGCFDKTVGLPSFASYAQDESQRTGTPVMDILRDIKNYYINIASANTAERLMVTGAGLFSHISGIVKDTLGKKDIASTDDIWQLEPLTMRFFTPTSTVLRHKLEQSAILYSAFRP
jgi:hypothetical protein